MKDNIVVVCHDAGGSEVISAYIRKYWRKYNFFCFVRGPGLAVFKKKLISVIDSSEKIRPLQDFFSSGKKIKMLLCGRSWGSKLELQSIQLAKERGIKTVVYLDHWVNYREAFGYPRQDWRKNLPDEIWAGDKYAYHLAKKLFSGMFVRFVPNLYFEEIKREYSQIKKRLKKKGDKILFIAEPVTSARNSFGDLPSPAFTEREIAREFLEYCIRFLPEREIIFRLHPAEKAAKYDDIIAKFKDRLKIKKSIKKNLIKDLIQAKAVIGMESMALAIAALCGKKTISFFLNATDHSFPLPFPEITRIRSFKNLKRVLN